MSKTKLKEKMEHIPLVCVDMYSCNLLSWNSLSDSTENHLILLVANNV